MTGQSGLQAVQSAKTEGHKRSSSRCDLARIVQDSRPEWFYLFTSQTWILEIQLFVQFGPHQPTNVSGDFILAECLLRFEVV